MKVEYVGNKIIFTVENEEKKEVNEDKKIETKNETEKKENKKEVK